MRVDVFLHRTGLVRRRVRARAECDNGNVIVNGLPAKASRDIMPGCLLELTVAGSQGAWRVEALPTGSRPKGEWNRYLSAAGERAGE